MRQIKNGSRELSIVNDKLGTPTYTHDFASNVKYIINKNERGLFNMVCEGFTGRLEVAHEIIRLLNMNDEIDINEVNSNFFIEKYFAERPNCERLVNKRLNDKGMKAANDIIREFGNKDLIKPILVENLPFKAKRPKDTSLKTDLISNLLNCNIYETEYSLKIIRDIIN